MDYLIHIVIVALLFAIVAESLDLLVGHTGLVSVCQAAFFGVGAYTAALVSTRMSGGFLTEWAVGFALCIVLSLAVSVPSLRLKDDYFVIATFGVQVIVFGVLNNWIELTRGPLGIPRIPNLAIFGWHVDTRGDFLVLSGLCLALAYAIVYQIASSPMGRVLHAIRGDEAFAKAQGKNTLSFKVTAVAVSAVIAAMAGGIYAHYITFVDPSGFSIMDSIMILAMVIIGGAGSLWGPLLGAIALVSLPEVLRFLGLPSSAAGNLRQILYGGSLAMMMVFWPRGLLGKYGFSK